MSFLRQLGLHGYSLAILRAGYDDLQTLASMSEGDMRDVGLAAHHAALLRTKLQEINGAADPEPEASHPVAVFLSKAGLAQYTDLFRMSGFDDMEALMSIDDQDLKDLGIPRGFAMKLLRAIREHQTHTGLADVSVHDAADQQLPRTRDSTRESLAPPPTREEFSSVRASWKAIEAVGLTTVAGVLIKHMFHLAPGIFTIVPPEVRARCEEDDEQLEGGQEIWNSRSLRKLFAKMLAAVGSLVAGVGDMGKLAPTFVKLGTMHHHYGVRAKELGIIGDALDMTLRDVLHEDYTFDVRAAWYTVYACISARMMDGFQPEIAEAYAAGRDTLEADCDGEVEVTTLKAQCASHSVASGALNLKDSQGQGTLFECETTCSTYSNADSADSGTIEADMEQQAPTTFETAAGEEYDTRSKE